MEKVFVQRGSSRVAANPWSVYWKRSWVRAVLEQAAEQAARTERATPATLVLSFPEEDPLRIFQALHCLSIGDCFYWEQPSQQTALVGAGTTVCIQTEGTERFASAALAWQQLRDEAVIHYDPSLVTNLAGKAPGPVLVGGFCFDPLRPRTSLWQDFSDGLLVLPRLLFRWRDQQATLSLSCLVRTTDNLDNLTDALEEEVTQLCGLVASFPPLSASVPLVNHDNALQDIWPAENWKALVNQTVHAIRQGEYSKVVLARAAQVFAQDRAFNLTMTLQCLRQSYSGAYTFAFQRGKRAFIGATPERLVYTRDGKLHTMALAGSAPRGSDAEEDYVLGWELLYSQKNREEHEIVTAMIHDSLAPLCSKIWMADTPEILCLKNIQHLQTAIVGELLPGRNMLEALQALHPTPAVGGAPTEPALAFIRAHENLDRGWYAGPVGWIDLHGDGEFAVALRSALLEKQKATLFAGCGIVKDSDPAAEYAESRLKLQVILSSLSGEDQG